MEKNEQQQETRTIECELAVREAAPDAQSESRTITGRAIVFNEESALLDDWGERFREVILPSAASQEFLDTQDIKLNMLHDRGLTLARCNKGKGSMRLWVDEKGVNFEFDAPKCDIGDRCLEMVRRGDYSGCSFEFYPDKYDVSETHRQVNGKDQREVKITHSKFRAITALTIGLDPAYKKTKVNARELLEQTPTYQAEMAAQKAEQEKAEAAQRERIAADMARRERVMAMNAIDAEPED